MWEHCVNIAARALRIKKCDSHYVLTRFADPLQVSIELSLDLLLSPQLEELAPVFHSFSLFGKFTVGTFIFIIIITRPLLFCSLCWYQAIIVSYRNVLDCVERWEHVSQTEGQRILPWEYTQHQVEHEEGANDDEGDVIHPVPGAALHIITLQETVTLLFMSGLKLGLMYYPPPFETDNT